MIYFKSPTGQVFAYETQAEKEQFAPIDLIPMTDEEVRLHLNPPFVDSVPQTVTMRQARLALLADSKLSQVDAVIDSLPEPQKSAARIEWDYSSEVQRDRPFVKQIGAALGYTDEQLDQLFIEASKL